MAALSGLIFPFLLSALLLATPGGAEPEPVDEKVVLLQPRPRTQPEDIPVIKLPTPETPVVFFHPRKSGGSSLRTLLYNRAVEAGVPKQQIVIPCVGKPKRPCDAYDLNSAYTTTQQYALVGGHFFWGAQERLVPFRGLDWEHYAGDKQKSVSAVPPAALAATEAIRNGDDLMPATGVSWQCITILREPVSRAVSCYYFRHKRRKGSKTLGDLDPEELRSIMLYGRDTYGHTCSNEMARIFTGFPLEWEVSQPGDWSEGFHAALLHRAANNMGRCILLDLDDMPGNEELLDYWAPWIAWRGMGHEKLNKSKPDEEFTPEQLEVLRDTNGADLALYEYAKEFRKRQLEFVRSKQR
jgi:hypothetical protein